MFKHLTLPVALAMATIALAGTAQAQRADYCSGATGTQVIVGYNGQLTLACWTVDPEDSFTANVTYNTGSGGDQTTTLSQTSTTTISRFSRFSR